MTPGGRARCIDCANYTARAKAACKLTRKGAAIDPAVLGWRAMPDWAPARPEGLHRCLGFNQRDGTKRDDGGT